MAHYNVYLFYAKYLDKLKHLFIVSKFKFPQEITPLLIDDSFEIESIIA